MLLKIKENVKKLNKNITHGHLFIVKNDPIYGQSMPSETAVIFLIIVSLSQNIGGI